MAATGREDGQKSLVRILALDGGGVRGLSSLLILRELMARIAIRTGETTVRPCDYFELIIGTGTGGISALFLGRMRMSVDQAIQEYMGVAETAFKPKAAGISRILPPHGALLDGAVLEDTIGKIVERILGDRGALLADQESKDATRRCRTAVLAATSYNADAPPYVFQSYADDTRAASTYTICEVARATSSTGGLFDPVTLGNPPIRFTDAGAAGYNNPSEIALRVAERLWSGRSVDCIVSVGTGLQRIISLDNKRSKIADACRALVENCEQVHDRLQHSFPGKESYFRFNVDRGLDGVDVMEWQEAGPRGTLSGITDSYMRWREVDIRLSSCVNVINQNRIGVQKNPIVVPGTREDMPRGDHPNTMKSIPTFNPASNLRNNPGETMPKRDSPDIRKFLPVFNPPPEIFHGRRDDVEKAASLLQTSDATRIAVLGTGGIGKTSIALTLLHDPRIVEKFKSDRRFVACESVNSPSQLVVTLCIAFGLEEGSANGLEDLLFFLTEEYASRPLLIVLDNFETVWDLEDAKPEAEALLRGLGVLPMLSVVLTVRGAEQPVGIRWSSILPVGSLDPDAARSTFIDVRSRDNFDDTRLDELLRAVDHVPLAVTLMARLGQNESPTALLSRWIVEHTRLLSRPQDKLRSNSVDVSIDISINSHRMKLKPEALRLLSVISVLPAGVFYGDLPAICPQIPELAEASTTLREVGLAYYDAESTLRVLSPIRMYILKHHPIADELLYDVRDFYFTLPRQAWGQPTPQDSSSMSAKIYRNAPNIEATITEALTLELETGRVEYWGSLNAALDWTRFILNTGPPTTIIEIALRVARERAARNRRNWSPYPPSPVGYDTLSRPHSSRSIDTSSSTVEHIPPTSVEQGISSDDATDFSASAAMIQDSSSDYKTTPSGVTDISGEGAVTKHLPVDHDIMPDGSTDAATPLMIIDASSNPNAVLHKDPNAAIRSGPQDHFSSGDGITPKDSPDPLVQTPEYSDTVSEGHTDGLAPTLVGLVEDTSSDHGTSDAVVPWEGPDRFSSFQLGNCLHSLGTVQRLKNDYDAAKANLFEARDTFQSINDGFRVAQCLWGLGDIYIGMREFDLARETLTQAATTFEEIHDRPWLAWCDLSLGRVQHMTGNRDIAQETFVKARDAFVLVDEPLGIGECLWSLGDIQLRKSELGPARQNFTEALALFESADHRFWIADCLLSLGTVQRMMADYEAAIETINKAMKVYEGLDNKRGHTFAKYNLVKVQRMMGEFVIAKENNVAVIQAFEALNDEVGLAECHWDMADICIGTMEYDAARESISKSKTVFQDLKDDSWLAWCDIILGRVQKASHELDLARESFEVALRQFQTSDDKLGIGECLWNLGDIHFLKFEYEIARDVFTEAMALFESINNRPWVADCLLSLGSVHRLTAEYGLARDTLSRARQEFEALHDQRGAAQAIHALATFLRITGDYDYAQVVIMDAKHAFEAIGDTHGVARCFWALSDIHIGIDALDDAREDLTQCTAGFEVLQDKLWLAWCNLCWGRLQRLTRDFDTAQKTLLKAQEGFKANRDSLGVGVGECLWNQGEIRIQKFEFHAALEIFNEALQIFTSVDHRKWRADCLLSMGHAHRMLNDYDTARETWTAARDAFEAIQEHAARQYCMDLLESISPAAIQHQGISQTSRPATSPESSERDSDAHDRARTFFSKTKRRLKKRLGR